MRTLFPRFGTTFRTTLFIPGAVLLLGACSADAPATGPTSVAPVAAVAGAPLLRWAPAVNAPNASAFVTTTDGRLLGVSETDGVFGAVGGTLRWSSLGTIGPEAGAFALASDGRGTLWAGTANGIYRSTDAGASWTASGLEGAHVRHVETNRDGAVYAAVPGAGGGVMRSDDGGGSWRMVFGPLSPRVGIIEWVTANGQDLLVGLYAQVPMHSRDGGETWEPAWGLWDLPNYELIANDMLATSRRVILVAYHHGVGRSTDGGATYQPVIENLTITRLVEDAARGAIYALAFDGRTFRSTDDGASWTPLVAGFRERNLAALGIAADGALVVGNWRGVWRAVPER